MNIQEMIKINKSIKKMKDAAINIYGVILPCCKIHIKGVLLKKLDEYFTTQIINNEKYLCFDFNTEDDGEFCVKEKIC